MTTKIETFSQCTVVLVATLTLMQGIVVRAAIMAPIKSCVCALPVLKRASTA